MTRRERGHWRDLGEDGRIIVKRMLRHRRRCKDNSKADVET
jgi:hypothetical protein